MTFGRVAILIGIAVLVLAANMAMTFLYMVIYGHLIDPGHDNEYYQKHVQVAAPYCSIVAGVPLMVLAGWWVSGFWEPSLGATSALIVWVAYAAIDVAICAAAGLTTRMWIFVAVSLLTKFAAAYFGAMMSARG